MPAPIETYCGQDCFIVNFEFLVCGQAVIQQLDIWTFVVQIPGEGLLTKKHELNTTGQLLLFEGLIQVEVFEGSHSID